MVRLDDATVMQVDSQPSASKPRRGCQRVGQGGAPSRMAQRAGGDNTVQLPQNTSSTESGGYDSRRDDLRVKKKPTSTERALVATGPVALSVAHQSRTIIEGKGHGPIQES